MVLYREKMPTILGFYPPSIVGFDLFCRAMLHPSYKMITRFNLGRN